MKLFPLLVRHQTGAVAATAVDFLAMIAWVEMGRGSPVTAAAVGAAGGALTNFLLGRRWIFNATGRSAAAQAVRYALVAVGSLALNSLGQAVLVRALRVPYVLSRVLVAAVVGMSWNFPLHRRFVFSGGRREVT
jgi:putative flippase GtrA